MKVVVVLKYPNIDVIADVNDSVIADYEFGEYDHKDFDNVYALQWIDKYVKMIPFRAAQHRRINIPKSNIAMMFKADEKLCKIHDEELQNAVPEFISESEYQEMIKKNQEKVNKTLGK